MEGALKKWTSIFRGYQERWVVLTFDGYLKYYENEPEDMTEPPKGKLKISIADIVRRDELRFRVISDDGQKFSFKAEDEDEADRWMSTLEEIRDTSRPELSDDEISEAGDNTDSISIASGISSSSSAIGDGSPKPKRYSSFKNVVKSVMTAEEITRQFRRLMIDRKRKNFQVVAAIDIGSSSTCCAFSLTSEYQKNPLNVHTVQINDHLKDDTVLLLNPNGDFDSFGSLAEEKYNRLMEVNKEFIKEWHLFRNFKMQLYNSTSVTKFMTVKDIGNKSMIVSTVFSLCLEYLHDLLLDKIKDKDRRLKEYDIRWVVTCPAMWNESARQFMIEAAEVAGIDRESIKLTLEPEAAAIYCKCLEANNRLKGTRDDPVFAPGAKFLIVDLGGGAVDITANEVMDSGQLKEIYNASGGPWGGNLINKKVWILIFDVFGNAVVQNFMNEHRADYLKMEREVEEAKKKFDFDGRFEVEVPDSLMDEAKKMNSDMTFDRNKDAVRVYKSNLIIEKKHMCSLFENCINTLCRKVHDVMNKPDTEGVTTILWVGGYSSCSKLREMIQESFPDVRNIYPSDPDMVVLKGAVIMGHMNTPIAKRLARFHYGMAVLPDTDFANSFNGTLEELTDIVPKFYLLIRKQTPIYVDDVVVEYDIPIKEGQTKVMIEVYASESDKPPTFISDEYCRKIGTIRMRLSNIKNDSNLKVGMTCDGTEFKAVGREVLTGRCFAGVCRFLE